MIKKQPQEKQQTCFINDIAPPSSMFSNLIATTLRHLPNAVVSSSTIVIVSFVLPTTLALTKSPKMYSDSGIAKSAQTASCCL